MYNIKDLREGRVVLKNNGTLNELRTIMKKAFPNSCVPTGIDDYYLAVSSDGWEGINHCNFDTPEQSVKSFLKYIKATSDKYTIEDLREGRVAVKHDDSLELLTKVLKMAFPNDTEPNGIVEYYFAHSNNNYWRSSEYDTFDLPVQSTKDFLEKNDKFPKVMLVSTSPISPSALKRVVIQEVNGGYLAWKKAETLEEARKATEAVWWQYAEDIREVPEYTMKELQEKIGHEFKIKK